MTGQGSYIKTSSGRAARTQDAHRLSAAMKRQLLKGMSVATPGMWQRFYRDSHMRPFFCFRLPETYITRLSLIHPGSLTINR
nr:MAG TPA: hypothetical protein [Caudoviricetes sp.]